MLATGVALFVAGCNPLTIEEPPVLAGDFSDPIYPKTYGRVSVDLSIDPSAASGEAGKTDTKALYLEFYFKAPDGKYILCKEYENYAAMPAVVLFPEGQYIVVARTKEYHTDREYFRGQTEMTVSETSTVVGKLTCLLLADEFADPIYPKIYGQVAVDLNLELGKLFAASRSVAQPEAQKMGLDFYFKAPDGQWILCKHYVRASDLPKGVSFPVGNYKLVVRSHEAMSEVMSEPYVHGETPFAVTAQTEIKPKVVCSVRNAWVELQPTEGFLRAVHSWGATFRQQSLAGPFVRLTKDSTWVRFVRPGVWNLELEGQQVGDNLPVVSTQPLGTLAGGDRAVAALDAVDRGVLGLSLEVKIDITQRDHAIVFPDDEGELGTGGYNPNPNPDPDPEPTTGPQVIGDGFDIDQVKKISKSHDFEGDKLKTPLRVTATAENGGLQKFHIKIQSTSPMLDDEMLTGIFGAPTFDLTNVPEGSQLEGALDNFGILKTGTPVKNEKSFLFELTDLMILLAELGTDLEPHYFILTVADGAGKTLTKTMSIQIID